MLRKLCTAMLALLLLATLTLSVSAAEVPDWETVDWETFDWKTIDDGDAWKSLKVWLTKDASLEALFSVTRNCAHAAYSETLSGIVYDRFMAKPKDFLIALGERDEKTQEFVLGSIVFEAMVTPKNEIVNTLEKMKLSYDKNPKAVLVLSQLVRDLQRNLKISIIIPDVSIDFASMDWDDVKLDTYFRDYRYYYIYQQWLEYKATLPYLFEWSRHTDGAFSTDFQWIAYKRFIAQPEKFLIALGKEDENTQKHIIFGIAFDAEVRDKDTTLKAVEGIRLSKEQNPKAVELMLALIAELEEHLQVSITIPKTGDPVMMAVAALLLSTAGLVLLKTKKIK